MNISIKKIVAHSFISSLVVVLFYGFLQNFPQTRIYGILNYSFFIIVLTLLFLIFPVVVLSSSIDAVNSGIKTIKYYLILFALTSIFFGIIYGLLNFYNQQFFRFF